MAGAFVSHRTQDIAAAERLARDLRSRGHRTWLDQWEVDLGDSIVGKINAGLASATHLILCYSDADVLAPWTSREWMSALARQLSGEKIRIIPARLSGTERPAILADIKYADLVADWDTGIAALDKALRR